MIADSHSHSLFSFDGHDDVATLCRAAIDRGISALAVTDHCDIDGVLDGLYPPYDGKAASEAILSAKEEFRGKLDIAFGVELGQPYLREKEATALIREMGYDFVLVSVHNLENVPDFYYLNYNAMPDALLKSLMHRAIDDLCRAASFPGADTLAHITYPWRLVRREGRPFDLSDFADEYRHLFHVMIENGTALELNTKMLRRGFPSDPPAELLRLYRDEGGELVTVGSDAHTAAEVGGGVPEAYELLRSLGFRYVSAAGAGGLHPFKI